ncbi:hypothetical protein YUYDRAFT_04526 [Streptomyces sp. ScaeMP-e48]|uniref:hypothetical protein n=1 Tax=Streptomyces TaxID=1883 RepID=UPI000823D55B|nr:MULTISPECIES: hypothetical protein [Streptomyces]SCK37698.1 hypothetical protein YUYDRAFT_04526 [Streptomyces sp. ScaeMP-e48]
MAGITKSILTGSVAAAFLVTMAASPAHAATQTYHCFTTGAGGVATVQNWHVGESGKNIGVYLVVNDNKADGHHVRVRLVGKKIGGTPVNWQWRANYGGNGTDKSWNTHFLNTGMLMVGVQVARFEGDTLLNSCTDWPET